MLPRFFLKRETSRPYSQSALETFNQRIKMKKQTNQSVKAHLLRGALILLSLLAICVIPFALASRSRGTAPAATDISKAPELPRTSQIPLASTSVIAAHVKRVPPAPKAP